MCRDCGGMKVERSIKIKCCEPRLGNEMNSCIAQFKKQQQQPLDERNSCFGNHEKHMTQSEDICKTGPTHPYHIPGYAGHVPTIQSRQGGTFGQNTHEILTSMDEEKPKLYNKTKHVCPPLHQPYHLPGYTGHVPGMQNMVGGTYGQDTHKLLFSPVPYPNRQENLSLYQPKEMNNRVGKGETSEKSTLKTKSHHENKPYRSYQQTQKESSSGPYKKPDEHYYHPQYKYRLGDTFATTADVTLVDPSVNKESHVIVSTRELDDTQIVRTHNCLEERVQDMQYINQAVRHRPMIPGFDAYIDALKGSKGQNFGFSNQSPSYIQLQQQLILEKGNIKKPWKSDVPSKKQNQHQTSQTVSNTDGIPYGYGKYTERPNFTNSVLYDFTSNYRRRQSSEWAPAGISRPDPPAFNLPGEIYFQHTGLLPGYSAHVPGAAFRCGKNFTDDSRDARRAIRGDRF